MEVGFKHIYNSEENTTLKQLATWVKKRCMFILLLTSGFVALSAVISFFLLTPQYQSNTTLLVGRYVSRVMVESDAAITYQEVQTNRLLVSTFGEIAKSRSVLDEVIKKLRLDSNAQQLRDRINVSLVRDTEIIQIDVTYENPEQAAAIANELAKSFSRKIVRIMNTQNIQVIDEAIPMYKCVKPKHVQNIFIALVAGLMLGTLIAITVEFLDTTIKTPEEVDKYLGLSVIGSIPFIKERGRK